MADYGVFQADERGRLVLSGYQPNQRYLVQEFDDGTIFVEPVVRSPLPEVIAPP